MNLPLNQINNKMQRNKEPSDPSSKSGSCQMVRIGEYLVMMGGDGNKDLKKMKDLYFLKIPTRIPWCNERVIWIGYYENGCVFSKCSRDVMRIIFTFLDGRRWL